MDLVDQSGIVTVESRFSVAETIDRLADLVQRAGLIVFARIDHGDGARDIGLELRPTELLIFGNPRGGTPLMLDRQIAGIDLPVKALAWQDESGKVWLSYNDGQWIAKRHALGPASAMAVKAIAAGMNKLIAGAVSS
jgi:uncharacterized protein (DUF302 family)